MTLSLVASVFASVQPAVGNECIRVQWQAPLNGGYVGLWDRGYCGAYVWWPGDSGPRTAATARRFRPEARRRPLRGLSAAPDPPHPGS